MPSALLKLGEISSWDNPIFDEANGSTGFWKPMTFLKQFGTGIYFMESYDAGKIPILFVHGATGTPRIWKSMAESIDQERFQPWVFYYPSGMRLDKISTALNDMIYHLQDDYGFKKIGVVAHSMGGLVSRSFILKNLAEESNDTIKVFVSLSTPWGGVASAAEGVEHAPEAIPSWRDVVPESEFIKIIYSEFLYSRVPHYLLFSYQGDSSMFSGNNDGTVEISSELDVRAQDDAVTVWGLNESHTSILESKKAIEYLTKRSNRYFNPEQIGPV